MDLYTVREKAIKIFRKKNKESSLIEEFRKICSIGFQKLKPKERKRNISAVSRCDFSKNIGAAEYEKAPAKIFP